MNVNKSLEQHIAVFGESGSGKTVLLSSFYGPTQEPAFPKDNLYEVLAENHSQRIRLHKNYLQMREKAQAPATNKFESHSYAFKITPKHDVQQKTPVDNLRLVWHDSPGEWFEQDPTSAVEAQRRVDTFRTLLTSDVAFLLVDAQRLLDNAGEEERYLKSLFTNFSATLKQLGDEILNGEEKLVEFPRIWVVAMSKADLRPDLDVYGFKELVTLSAGEELIRLRDTIAELVDGAEALSLDDYMLLSSAKFAPEKIDLSEPIGVDLVLPLAAMLPFERHARWVEEKVMNKLPNRVAVELLKGADVLVALLYGKRIPIPGPFGAALAIITAVFTKEVVSGLLDMAKTTLEESRKQALEKHQYFRAVLTGFRIALADAEEKRILRRSRQ